MPNAEAGKQKTAHWSAYDIFQKAAFGVLLKLLASCSLGIFKTGWEAGCNVDGICWESYCGVGTKLPGKLVVVLVKFSKKFASWNCTDLLRKPARMLGCQ